MLTHPRQPVCMFRCSAGRGTLGYSIAMIFLIPKRRVLSQTRLALPRTLNREEHGPEPRRCGGVSSRFSPRKSFLLLNRGIRENPLPDFHPSFQLVPAPLACAYNDVPPASPGQIHISPLSVPMHCAVGNH